MNNFYKFSAIILSLIGVIGLILIAAIVVFDNELFSWSFKLSSVIAANIGGFISGVIGTLFSGAAFFLLYLNLLQIEKTNFENKINSLMNLFHEVSNNISGHEGYKNDNESKPISGTDFFDKSIKYFNNFIRRYTGSPDFDSYDKNDFEKIPSYFEKFENLETSGTEIDIEIDKSLIESYLNKKYLEFYHFRKVQLGHYFRFLYNIIKIIDTKKGMSFDEKKKNVDVIQAQLSNAELGLIFYNCISTNGQKKFHPLIDKYGFLENLDKSYITYPQSLAKFYPLTNFKFIKEKQTIPKRIILPSDTTHFAKYSGENDS